MVSTIVSQHSETLLSYNIDPKRFAETVTESLLLNPLIIKADPTGLQRAIRACCREGLLPNGREAAIIVNQKTGFTSYQTMKEGLLKIIYDATGADFRAGHWKEGDEAEIIEGAGFDASIRIMRLFTKDPKPRPVIGAYLWIKEPGKNAEIFIFDAENIAKAKSMGNTYKDDSAWNVWEGKMAEKSVIKSACNSMLYRVASSAMKNRMIAVIEGEDTDVPAELEMPAADEDGVLIEEEEEVEQKPEPKPKPRARRKKETPEPPKEETLIPVEEETGKEENRGFLPPDKLGEF